MVKNVRCPTCGGDVQWNGEAKFRPFCSERCKMIDLGAWASDDYSITGADQGDGDKPDASSRLQPSAKH